MTEVIDKVLARLVQPRPDCLLWPDPNHKGYGIIRVDGKWTRVHRLAWEAQNGPIPEGMVVDHLCRIRSCCNTEHMEVVTPAENVRRRVSSGLASWSAGSVVGRRLVLGGTCAHDHDLISEDDIYISPGGKRQCRQCRREQERRRDTGRGVVFAP